jgi:hypothetical protein
LEPLGEEASSHVRKLADRGQFPENVRPGAIR